MATPKYAKVHRRRNYNAMCLAMKHWEQLSQKGEWRLESGLSDTGE